MATAIAGNILRATPIGMNGREVKRIELPNYRSNPLLVHGVESASSASVEAFKSLRTHVMKAHATRGICTIAITSAAHSDGKTLTSFNLACCCAQLESTPVLLVDADLRTSGLTKLVGSLPQFGLADVLAGERSFDDAVVGTDVPNLYVIGAGNSRISPAELFSGERWQQFLQRASQHFELVLMDSLPVRAVADFDLIAAASDGILMVVRALKTPREGVEDAFSQLDTNKLVGVVWNGAAPPPKYSSYKYADR